MKLRLVCVLATNGRVLSYDYGTAADINDVTSRVQSIKFAAEAFNLVDYQYLGASGFVNAASSQPGTNWTLYGSSNDPNTGDIYSGLDRFGRVDNCLWQKGSTTLAQIQYGYDRASNRTWRKDGVLTGYDELYLYDGLNRLKDQIRGTLNGTQTAITTRTFQQQWGLDATGNWQAFKQDTDGNGTWDLVQSRTANKANEITAINNTTGTAWVTPGYDRAGNMIGIPNPTISSTATYDAWNRLISVTDASTSITNDYDARGFRITETTGGVVRRYHYTPGWQCVEERTGSLTTPERQFVWEQLRPPTDEGGSRPKAVAGNVDSDLVIRDRSTANNGSINERRYAMQDGNWNTVAICDITGTVGERYAYSAYGTPVFMTGAGTVQTSSPIGFETLYAGYRWDNPAPQMYYVRNRFLLPQIGTWNKRDPLGYVDGMGLYAVVRNEPISTLDSYGLRKVCCLHSYSTGSDSWVSEIECGEFETAKLCCSKLNGTFYDWKLLASADRPCDRVPNPTRVGAAATACCASVVAIPTDPSDVVGTPGGCLVAVGAGLVWLISSKDIPKFPPIPAAPPPLPPTPGLCEFYLAWCQWGNRRKKGDKGKGWKRGARCSECYTDCKKNGMWSFGKCPIGDHGSRWRGQDDSVWPDD